MRPVVECLAFSKCLMLVIDDYYYPKFCKDGDDITYFLYTLKDC